MRVTGAKEAMCVGATVSGLFVKRSLIVYGIRAMACFLALLFAIGEAHELIPGLHTEDEPNGLVVCPFCKLIFTPVLAVSAIIFLLIPACLCRVGAFEAGIPSRTALSLWRGRAPPCSIA